MALTNEDLRAIESMLEPIKRDIRSIQLTLENETNRNIKLIAEGHLDLSRKLNEAISVPYTLASTFAPLISSATNPILVIMF